MSAPLGWITDESLRRLSRGGNCKGSVPIHQQRSNVAKTPVVTADAWAELIAAANAVSDEGCPCGNCSRLREALARCTGGTP